MSPLLDGLENSPNIVPCRIAVANLPPIISGNVGKKDSNDCDEGTSTWGSGVEFANDSISWQ